MPKKSLKQNKSVVVANGDYEGIVDGNKLQIGLSEEGKKKKNLLAAPQNTLVERLINAIHRIECYLGLEETKFW